MRVDSEKLGAPECMLCASDGRCVDMDKFELEAECPRCCEKEGNDALVVKPSRGYLGGGLGCEGR